MRIIRDIHYNQLLIKEKEDDKKAAADELKQLSHLASASARALNTRALDNEYLHRTELLTSLNAAGFFNGGETALIKVIKKLLAFNIKTDKRKDLLERYII